MHGLILAASCYPNCHPANWHGGAVAESGNTALGLAFFGLIALLLLSRRRGGG